MAMMAFRNHRLLPTIMPLLPRKAIMTVSTRLCIYLSLLLGGCASVPQNQVAPTSLPSLAGSAHKPSVRVAVEHLYGDPDLRPADIPTSSILGRSDAEMELALLMVYPVPAPLAVQQHSTQAIRQLLEDSGMFERVSMTADPIQAGDYQLFVRVTEYWPLESGEALASMATLLTLGIVPSSRSQRFQLTLDVLSPERQPLGRVGNRDAIEQRVGLINLAKLGYSHEKAERNTLKRQLDALLAEVSTHFEP